MHVVVTGGHGAIGRFVVEGLDARGHDITVFDLHDEPFRSQLGHRFVRGDVTNGDAVSAAIAGADVVVHLATLKRPACEADPRRAHEVNVGGTVNVFEAAVAADARVVHVSTKSVFGHISGRYAYPQYEPLPEDAPQQPVGDIYGLTKRATESYRTAYCRKHDLEAASVRFASTYGPGKVAVSGKGLLIPDAIERASRGETVHLRGGDELNDWIYFGDVAVGLADAVEAPTLSFPAYHVGTGELHSLRDFAAVLRTACPDATITVEGGRNPQQKDHPMYARLDISRARDDLGYEPRYGLADGVRHYLDRLDDDRGPRDNGGTNSSS